MITTTVTMAMAGTTYLRFISLRNIHAVAIVIAIIALRLRVIITMKHPAITIAAHVHSNAPRRGLLHSSSRAS